MKKFKKPYLSCFLAFLILFSSCQKTDESIESKLQHISLEEFTAKHLSLSKSIFELIRQEDNVDSELLANRIEKVNSKEELLKILKDSNVSNHNELGELFEQLVTNNQMFINSNPQFFNLEEQERISIITSKINELSDNDYASKNRLGPCEDARATAENRCSRNFAIATGVAFASGLVSLGWGTLIGWGAAWAMVTLCLNDAGNDYLDCTNQ